MNKEEIIRKGKVKQSIDYIETLIDEDLAMYGHVIKETCNIINRKLKELREGI